MRCQICGGARPDKDAGWKRALSPGAAPANDQKGPKKDEEEPSNMRTCGICFDDFDIEKRDWPSRGGTRCNNPKVELFCMCASASTRAHKEIMPYAPYGRTWLSVAAARRA